MTANPTPLPGNTWHVAADEMYPAIMDKLVAFSDEVRALRDEVANLRHELRSLRYAALGFVSVVAIGGLVVAAIALLRS